jgi:hypothetical protein
MGVTETLGMFVYFLVTGGIAVAMGVRHRAPRIGQGDPWETEGPALLGERDRLLNLRSPAPAAPALFGSEVRDQGAPARGGIAPVYVIGSDAGRSRRGRPGRLHTTPSRSNAANAPAGLGMRSFSSGRR